MMKRLVASDSKAAKVGRTLGTEAAAALLGTSVATLRLWEQRFGYPVPAYSRDGKPHYHESALIALRDALRDEVSIVSAIARARRAC